MKIRHPLFLKILSFVVAWVVRLWIGTVRYRYRPLGANYDPNGHRFRGRYIYAFWHENMLMPVYQYGGHDIYVLISQSGDGQLIAESARHLGFKTVRGSTTRGGLEAVREMLHRGTNSQLAVTPDGPRGPRRQVQMGLIFLAAKTGLPIVPIGMAFHRAWRLNSWDRFALPFPGSRVSCVTTEAIVVPEKIDKKELERYRQMVQDAIDRATEAAERLRP